VRKLAEEGSGTAVEVELLGEPREEVNSYTWVLWVCKDEVLNGNDFDKVFVLIHKFLKHRVSSSS
jgi:hypothetical protein